MKGGLNENLNLSLNFVPENLEQNLLFRETFSTAEAKLVISSGGLPLFQVGVMSV